MTYIQVPSLFSFCISILLDMQFLHIKLYRFVGSWITSGALVMPKSFGPRTISDRHNLDENSGQQTTCFTCKWQNNCFNYWV